MGNTNHTDKKENGNRRMREPPEVRIDLLKMRSLPKISTDWESIETKFLPVDFLLLTAKDCELLSCLSFLHDIDKGYTKTLSSVYFGFRCQQEPKLKIAVIKGSKSSIVRGGSLDVESEAVPILKPKAVIWVGCCGSLNDEKAKLGDVIISSKLITYSLAKDKRDGIVERDLVVTPNKLMDGLIKDFEAGWEAPLRNSEAMEVTVHWDGVFLTGPRWRELTERFPEGTAIDVEGEGLHTAAGSSEFEWLVIKGVSNFADGSESGTDAWRQFASVMAASLVFHKLDDTIVFEDWPHCGNPSKRKRQSLNTDYTRTKVARGMSADDSDSGDSSRSRKRSWQPGPGPDPKRSKPPEGESSSEDAEPGPTLREPRTPRSRERPLTTSGVKDGTPSDKELQELSREIPDKWISLGERLGYSNDRVTGFGKNEANVEGKAYVMLLAWKRREGPDATYRVLYEALCDMLVERKDLGDKFCCQRRL